METRNIPSDCPDSETLAGFLDGRLDAAGRAQVEAHLSTCDACRELFAESFRFLDQGSAAPERMAVVTPRWRSSRILLPLAAAAALATLAFVLTRTSPPREEHASTQLSMPGAEQAVPAPPASIPMPSGDLRMLVRHAWKESAAARGFAGTRRPAGAALLLGVHRTDLALALRVSDLDAARAAVDRILGLLEEDAPSIAEYRALRRAIDEGREPSWPTPGGAQAGRVALGEWLEAARLASVVHDRSVFDAPGTPDTLRALSATSPAAARKVADVERLTAAGPRDAAGWEDLERALADLIRMP